MSNQTRAQSIGSAMTRGAAALIVVAALLGTEIAATAVAETPLASYVTYGCPASTPVWRIGYRLYFNETKGSDKSADEPTTRDVIPEVLAQARAFADEVGRVTACAMRVRVDVADLGNEQWLSGDSDPRFPDDHLIFRASHPVYDSVFYRFPVHLDRSFCADTHQYKDGAVSRFGVDGSGGMACSAPGAVDPSAAVLTAAWAQNIMGFYEPRQGWLATCNPNYALTVPCDYQLLNEASLTELLQGRLVSGGRTVGILPDEWALQGTPRHPVIRDTPVAFKLTPVGVRLDLPADLPAGLVQLRVSHPIGQHIRAFVASSAATRIVTRGKPGLWKICAATAGTGRYRKAKICFVVSQPTRGGPHLHPFYALPKILHTRRAGGVTTILTDYPDNIYERWRLVVRRGNETVTAAGHYANGGSNLTFKLHLSPGIHKVAIRGLVYGGGPSVTSCSTTIRVPA